MFIKTHCYILPCSFKHPIKTTSELMKKRFVILFFLMPWLLQAQTINPEETLKKANKYQPERIFIHLNKGQYVAGENLVFKAYIFYRFQLSPISTNLYVECLDKNKKVIYANIFPILKGIANGNFNIPKNTMEDVYYFRAYTSWMLNFNEKVQFIQPFNIYNSTASKKLVASNTIWNASIYPEGGKLLDNIETKCTVRLTTNGNLPVKWSGYIYENNDSLNVIAKIVQLNEAVGITTFTPVFGKQYRAKIIDENNIANIILLPTVANAGVTIKTQSLSGGINFQLIAKGIENNLQGFKIMAHNEGDLIYSAIIKNNKTQLDGFVPLDSSIKGIVYFTIFDAKGNVAAERICFANYDLAINDNPIIDFTQKTPKARKLNEWQLNVDTAAIKSYTIEILNASTNKLNNYKDILTTFWLNDFSIKPINSNNYFIKDDAAAQGDLDYFLISAQPDFFSWTNLSNTTRIKYLPDNFISYQGTAFYKKAPLSNGTVDILFQVNDTTKIVRHAQTDSLGKFKIDKIRFSDTAKLYYSVVGKKNEDMTVHFNRILDTVSYKGNLPTTAFYTVQRQKQDSVPQSVKNDEMVLSNIEKAQQHKELQEVVVTARKKSPKEELNNTLSTPMFREPSEIVFDFVNEEQDLGGGSDIISWLNGRAAGITADGMSRGKPIKIYIDEFEAAPGQLDGIPVSSIAMVKVLRNAVLLGTSSTVVSIYTKDGRLYKAGALQQTAEYTTVIGYPSVTAPKNTVYNTADFDATEHDTRTVLYWNDVLQPVNNKATIRFYNNDITKKPNLLVIGFGSNGLPVFVDQAVDLQ